MTTQFVLADQGSWWYRLWFGSGSGASTQAADTEWLFMFILWVNILSFAILMAIMGYFMLKYRRSRQAEQYQVSVAHNTPLELAWSIIPLLVMVPIFWWGFKGYVGKLAAPSDAEEIRIRGSQWMWDFTYKNGAKPQSDLVFLTKTDHGVPDFVVPQGRPVKLIMSSADVIHAFYVPDFRTKMDVIPNRYISMWFQAHELGSHKVFCAEYCGQDHSEMAAQLRVVSRDEYERTLVSWLGPSPGIAPVEYGKRLYERACKSCHSVDGSKGTGPSWKDLYGTPQEIEGGPTVGADDDYLRESILYSQKKIVKGYPGSMPVFAGQLSDVDVEALIFYIKSLSSKTNPEEMTKGLKTYKELEESKDKK